MSVAENYANAIAQLEMAKGEALAQGRLRSGQLWGGTIAGIGQMIGQQPMVQQEMDLRNQHLQMGQMQMQQMQRQQAQEDAVNAALSEAITPSGIDVDKLRAKLSGTPGAAAFPAIAEKLNAFNESGVKLQKARLENDALERDNIADLADAASHVEHPADQAAILYTGILANKKNGLIDPKRADEYLGILRKPDGSPNEEAVAPLLAKMRGLRSPASQEKLAQVAAHLRPSQPTEMSVALAATGGDPAKAMALAHPPPVRSMEEQLLEARVSGDTAKADQILSTMTAAAEAKKDPATVAQANALRALTIEEAKARLANLQNAPTKRQEDLEKDYRNALITKVESSRSGGLGLEDQKVNQATHLLTMFEQSKDKDGNYHIPRVMQTELALGLARLISPTGQVGAQLEQEINQRTAKGDLAGALTYLTGRPLTGNTQDIFKMYRDSILRQGTVAEQNRNRYLDTVRASAPSDLAPDRREKVEQALTHLTSVTKGDYKVEGRTTSTPPPNGQVTLQKFGATYKWDGTKYVKQ